ncbi:MAG: hypothetical protein ACE5JL_14630 [Dehalococcoidia bacterium]
MSLKKQLSFKQKVKEILWGFFFFDFYKEVIKTKAKYEDALNLVILGELLGVPLMNSTIALKLLPYLFPELSDWKRRQLKEKEPIDSVPPTV